MKGIKQIYFTCMYLSELVSSGCNAVGLWCRFRKAWGAVHCHIIAKGQREGQHLADGWLWAGGLVLPPEQLCRNTGEILTRSGPRAVLWSELLDGPEQQPQYILEGLPDFPGWLYSSNTEFLRDFKRIRPTSEGKNVPNRKTGKPRHVSLVGSTTHPAL